MWNKIQGEPALATGFVAAFISLVTAFGLHLSTSEIGGIMAFVAAALAFVTRNLVTPVINIPTPASIPVSDIQA